MSEEIREFDMVEFNHDKIISLLKGTGRTGIIGLIDFMEEGGFFTAPCSGQYHLAEPGGLAEHSLNVYFALLGIDGALDANIPLDSIIICGILHDLGKMGDYGKGNYIANILKSGEQSKSKPYVFNSDLLYVPHEIRSIAIAQRFITLTEDEQFAILYHNGLYTPLGNSYKGKETPLSMALHFADMWCSRVTEAGEKKEGEEE